MRRSQNESWMAGAIIAGLLVAPSASVGQEPQTREIPAAPPAYKLLRFDEDYSYLAGAVPETDWLDPIKYIPLGSNPKWFMTLGGELRERFEGAKNPGFGVKGDHDAYLLERATLLVDLHLGERLRVFAEGISGIIAGQSRPAPPVQNDPIDLQAAFVDLVPYVTSEDRLTLRAGRFAMSLGSGRLVATRAAPNIPFRFDGFELLYSHLDWKATAFLTRPAKDSGAFDGDDHSTAFGGVYLTGWLAASRALGVDLYYLGIRRKNGKYASGSGDEHRHSFGAREFGQWQHWDWDAEEVLQFGRFHGDPILAWTASIDAGHTWELPWKPRLGAKLDVASGDRDAKDHHLGTFDALFFKSGYFNDASLIRPQNVIDVHPKLALQLSESVSADSSVDVFWRYSRSDAVYAVPGPVALRADEGASAYVGTAVDVNMEWRLDRHLSVQASYVHFFVGDYPERVGGRDVDFGSTTLSFLF